MAAREKLWVGKKRDGSIGVVKDCDTKHDSGAWTNLQGPFQTRRAAVYFLDCLFSKNPLPSIKECEKLSLIPEEYQRT